MSKNMHVMPIVKWVGGKRQIIEDITRCIPKFSTYYEPFLGGGAVLFELQPQKALVNDQNEELMNMYTVIRDNVEDLIHILSQHQNDKEHFYKVRELDRDKKLYATLSNIEKAARIIYLNKTCYNGLFRVNLAGEFNTPFGKYKNPKILDEVALRAVSQYLNKSKVRLLNEDFEASLKGIRKGAFVYFDPPYDPISDTASFTGYDKGGFGKEEQIRLKKVCDRLNERGIKFLLSNSATDFIQDLYKDYRITFVKARRAINSIAEKRGEVDEVLVMNYA